MGTLLRVLACSPVLLFFPESGRRCTNNVWGNCRRSRRHDARTPALVLHRGGETAMARLPHLAAAFLIRSVRTVPSGCRASTRTASARKDVAGSWERLCALLFRSEGIPHDIRLPCTLASYIRDSMSSVPTSFTQYYAYPSPHQSSSPSAARLSTCASTAPSPPPSHSPTRSIRCYSATAHPVSHA